MYVQQKRHKKTLSQELLSYDTAVKMLEHKMSSELT